MNNISDWYDFALGEHAAIDINNDNRLRYWLTLLWCERERTSDNAMRLAYIIGTVLLPGLRALSSLTDAVTSSFEDVWSFWDSAYAMLAASRDIPAVAHGLFSKNKNCMPPIKYKQIFSLLDACLATSTAAATIVTAVGASTAAGPIGVATCMWASLAKSAHATHIAHKKCDAVYLFYDRLLKLKHANLKLNIIKQQTDDNENNLVYQQQLQTVNHLSLEVKAIFHVHQAAINNALEQKKGHYLGAKQYEEMINLVSSNEAFSIKNENTISVSFKQSVSNETANLYKHIDHHLKHKQREKYEDRVFESFNWSLAAVGMTLIAIGVFCPPVTFIGTVCAAIAGILKGIELIKNVRGPLSAEQKSVYDRKILLASQYSEDSHHRTLALKIFRLKRPNITDDQFTEFWNDLGKNPKKKQRLIKRTIRTDVENTLLLEYLDGKTTSSDSKVDEKQSYINSMSERDRSHMLKSALQAIHDKQSLKTTVKTIINPSYDNGGFHYHHHAI